MDYMKDLEAILHEKIAEKTRKIKNSGMNDGDLETIDKLTHALASVKKIMAFTDDGYSGSYRDGYRGTYATKRDSMGRYSRDNLADKMRELMMDAPDDRTRQEMHRLVERLEG